MKKTKSNLILLNAIFCTCIVISNVISPRLIDTCIPWISGTIVIPGACLMYAVSYLATDIISEIYGKIESAACVKRGFITQILATLFILLTQYLPWPVYAEDSVNAYSTLLGMNWVFVTGSLVSFWISQNIDVKLFHKIKEKNGNNHKKRWQQNNGSTMVSQLADTIIYITIAFGLGVGYILPSSPNYNPQLFGGMLLGQYLVKFIIAALDTPFFYFFTRNPEDREVGIPDNEKLTY